MVAALGDLMPKRVGGMSFTAINSAGVLPSGLLAEHIELIEGSGSAALLPQVPRLRSLMEAGQCQPPAQRPMSP